jgi:hypothetical protein
VLILVWVFGTNNPGLLLALGLVVAGTAFILWRTDRAEMRSVLGELGPSSEKPSPSKRAICLVAGHKWMPAAEALDPHNPGDVSAVSYAGDGDDTVVLVCRRCGSRKAVGVEDFRRRISGPSGYGPDIDP